MQILNNNKLLPIINIYSLSFDDKYQIVVHANKDNGINLYENWALLLEPKKYLANVEEIEQLTIFLVGWVNFLSSNNGKYLKINSLTYLDGFNLAKISSLVSHNDEDAKSLIISYRDDLSNNQLFNNLYYFNCLDIVNNFYYDSKLSNILLTLINTQNHFQILFLNINHELILINFQDCRLSIHSSSLNYKEIDELYFTIQNKQYLKESIFKSWIDNFN